MICSVCGRNLPGELLSCPACGTAVAGSSGVNGFLTPDLQVTGISDGPLPDSSVPIGDRQTASNTPRTPGRTSIGFGPLLPGEAFGSRYHIIKLLGAGGMGAVYQAWDAELSLTVAIKVVLAARDGDSTAATELERRFKQELVLARQVTHKNVVRIHDLGEIDGIKYITMSYIEGEDLLSLLKREGRLSVSRVLEIARPIVSGLVAAHQAGIVHRDLKPANIMVDAAHGEAVIMDFGIARTTGTPVVDTHGIPLKPGGAPPKYLSANRTMAGTVVGTLEYMAPEQGKGQAVDQRADIYAFGLMLYDMLVGGRRAARTTSALDELRARMIEPPASPKSIVPEIPEAFDRLVMKCLAPAPGDRYQTTLELSAALDHLDQRGEPIKVRRVVGMRGLAAVVAAAVSLIGLSWWTASRGSDAAPQAAISVVIADFENQTGEPIFEGTVENALSIALEGASFITSYRRGDAQLAIQQISPGARLDEAGARLLSAREGIKVVVTGAIERTASGYAVTVNALDPAVNAPLATARERASSRDDVLRAVGSIASEIRSALGDQTPETTRLAAAETVTAASLEALQSYTRGQELQINSKYVESIEYYNRAIQQDPKFGRAYASWAVSAYSLGRREEADALYKKAFALMDRMTEREKYRTYGTYYLTIARNYQQAIDNYTTLLGLYPSDRASRTNLAFAYFNMRDFARALEENTRALDIYAGSFKLWSNHALYAMYAGDFVTAEEWASRVLEQSPTAYRAYLPRAMAALSRGDIPAAREVYAQMAKTDPQGGSLASMGLADLLIYSGALAEAETELKRGIAADRAIKSPAAVAAKSLAMAEALFARQQSRAATAAVEQALDANRDESTLVAAARLQVALGHTTAAREIVAVLDKRLPLQPRAYARLIEGEIAAREGRFAQAVEAFGAALKLADLWLARFALGVAYVQAEAYAEGLRELEISEKRRGEATAVFLDDVPSYRYLATLPYWLGRAQEGVGQQTAAADNFRKFLALRSSVPGDALAADARKRLQ